MLLKQTWKKKLKGAITRVEDLSSWVLKVTKYGG